MKYLLLSLFLFIVPVLRARMSKFFVFLVVMNLLSSLSVGQNNHALKGKIVDENNQALKSASVILYPIEKGTTSNEDGNFVINNLKKGDYKIEISFVGYRTISDSIEIKGDKTYNAQLSVASLNLQEVVITNNYAEKRKKEEPLNIEIVNDDYLKQNLGGSLMKSLERLPGVTTIDIGSGLSKPVIRGLGFNRVVVVENSLKHEAQQWGAGHGLEIDQYSIDNIEVIKGPASLMYGSDAIGGVIDMKNHDVPRDNTIRGTIDITGKSNNNMGGTSASIRGRKNSLFASLRATFLEYGDYKVPTDSIDIYSYRAALHENQLRNTAGREKNLHLSFGVIRPEFQSRFFISNVNGKNGFFANAQGLEPRNVDEKMHDKSSRDINYPYHEVNHFKVINRSRLLLENHTIELDLGFQRNFRQEWSRYVNHGYMPAIFPDSLDFNPDLERGFEKYVYSGNLKFMVQVSDKTSFIGGINSDYQDNRIDGRGFIIPAFKHLNAGSYIFGKHHFSGKSLIQLGVRYDYGHINTRAYQDWFPSPVDDNNGASSQFLERAGSIERDFSNISWSVGYNYNPGNWSYKFNVGKSFRMPIAKELAANGVNYHRFSYEVGDPDLSPEISYQFDAGLEYSSEKLAIGTSPFLNYFTNYIYLNPTSEHDRLYGNGNQVFYYTQSQVLRYGAEIHAHYHFLNNLQMGLIGEYVYSEQLSGEKKGFTLPFSPPATATLNLKYKKQRLLGFIRQAYMSVDYKFTAPQHNIVPPEETTAGYRSLKIGLGGDVTLKNQKISIALQVQNLLNRKYFNHTSFYRLINVPEPGRNFIVNISIPFSGKFKRE